MGCAYTNGVTQSRMLTLVDLDQIQVDRSYKQPNLFTITVDPRQSNGHASPSPQQDLSQWHLPAPDQRNEGKYMFKIHTLDLYFWTVDDATLFKDSLRRVLQSHQLRTLDAPNTTSHSEHKDVMSPVVAKLENAAISNPNSFTRTPSVSTTQSFSGPPTSATPGSASVPSIPQQHEQGYAPIAYNPAAPAAPEPIAHREKTPPPPDAETGTGLKAGGPGAPPQQYGQGQFVPSAVQHQGPISQGFTGPPQNQTPPSLHRAATTNSFPPPPPGGGPSPNPYAQPNYSPSFGPPPTDPYAQQQQTPTPPQLHRQSTMPVTQYANYPPSSPPAHLQSPGMMVHPRTPGQPPMSPGFTGPPGTPGVPPPMSPGYAAHHAQQQQHDEHAPPPGGYASFSYGSSAQYQLGQGQAQPVSDPYALHAQAYRPTEAEAHHGAKPFDPNKQGLGQQRGKTEDRMDKLEKGVGRFLKKLDKKF